MLDGEHVGAEHEGQIPRAASALVFRLMAEMGGLLVGVDSQQLRSEDVFTVGYLTSSPSLRSLVTSYDRATGHTTLLGRTGGAMANDPTACSVAAVRLQGERAESRMRGGH
jgi:hypothetical protein